MGAPSLNQNLSREGIGKADTLMYNVCTYVAEEKYEAAIHALEDFLNQESEYPKFRQRIEKYIRHSIDLVHAIKAKRSFPGIQSLTMSKQQELVEKYREHFDEMKEVLKKIEKVQNELKMEDVRSTVWVVKATANAIFAVVLVAFLVELYKGLAVTGYVVIDDLFTKIIDWVFDITGF